MNKRLTAVLVSGLVLGVMELALAAVTGKEPLNVEMIALGGFIFAWCLDGEE